MWSDEFQDKIHDKEYFTSKSPIGTAYLVMRNNLDRFLKLEPALDEYLQNNPKLPFSAAYSNSIWSKYKVGGKFEDADEKDLDMYLKMNIQNLNALVKAMEQYDSVVGF